MAQVRIQGFRSSPAAGETATVPNAWTLFPDAASRQTPDGATIDRVVIVCSGAPGAFFTAACGQYEVIVRRLG